MALALLTKPSTTYDCGTSACPPVIPIVTQGLPCTPTLDPICLEELSVVIADVGHCMSTCFSSRIDLNLNISYYSTLERSPFPRTYTAKCSSRSGSNSRLPMDRIRRRMELWMPRESLHPNNPVFTGLTVLIDPRSIVPDDRTLDWLLVI